MEQTSGKSLALRESVMELFIEQKVDHENRPHFLQQNGNTIQSNQYYPYGKSWDSSYSQPYLYNGKEIDMMHDLEWYDYGARMYEPGLCRFMTMDPLCEKYYNISPYAYCANNPVNLIDINGDTITVDKTGQIINTIGNDNNVYLKDENMFKKIGELGKIINVDDIYSNLLNKNVKLAKKMWNPLAFIHLVKSYGEWDLKNNPKTIWSKGINGTLFSFHGTFMEAQDIGNHHFGVMIKAFGLVPESYALAKAGDYQVKSGTSKKEWQKSFSLMFPNVSSNGTVSFTPMQLPVFPYGDDPRDQMWIKSGFTYWNNHYK